jgi:hypothetical protein
MYHRALEIRAKSLTTRLGSRCQSLQSRCTGIGEREAYAVESNIIEAESVSIEGVGRERAAEILRLNRHQ